MKKIILTLFVVSIILFSCQKEIVNDEFETESNTENYINYDKITIFDINNNELVNKNSVLSDNSALVVESYNEKTEKYLVRFFSGLDELSEYAENRKNYTEVFENIQMVFEIQKLAKETGDFYLENPSNENISNKMKTLLEEYSPDKTQKTSGMCILFDGINHNGQSFGLLGNPFFTFGSFRNKASSGLGLTLGNFVCSKRWFTGRYLFLVSQGPFNLGFVGMNNDAESGR